MLLKNNVIVHLKMITQQSSPDTYTVIDAKTKKAFYINGAKSIDISPKLTTDTTESLIVTRTGFLDFFSTKFVYK